MLTVIPEIFGEGRAGLPNGTVAERLLCFEELYWDSANSQVMSALCLAARVLAPITIDVSVFQGVRAWIVHISCKLLENPLASTGEFGGSS